MQYHHLLKRCKSSIILLVCHFFNDAAKYLINYTMLVFCNDVNDVTVRIPVHPHTLRKMYIFKFFFQFFLAYRFSASTPISNKLYTNGVMRSIA